MKFPSGGSYTGEFKQGMFWGKGVLSFCSGARATGTFVSDLNEGEFTIIEDRPVCDTFRCEGVRATWRRGPVSTGVYRADKREGLWTTVEETEDRFGKTKTVWTTPYVAGKAEGDMIKTVYSNGVLQSREVVASYKNGVEDLAAAQRREQAKANAAAINQAVRLRQCQQLAYNLPGGMVPRNRGDIGRVCSNGWRYGSADWVKCRDEMDACWDILNR